MANKESLVARMAIGLVGVIASYYASKLVEKWLDEKPLADRYNDFKDIAKDVQVKVTDGVLNAAGDFKKRVSKTDVPPV